MSLARAQVKLVRSVSWVDLLLFSAIAAFIYGLIRVAAEWTGPFHSTTTIDLSYQALPWYSFLSLVRGFIAYFFSLAFTFFYGYAAAHTRFGERILIPLLDILQGIPVLGFLPGVVLALVKLFPNSNIGLEMACILMIFNGQVWNMTFSFYGSVKGVSTNWRELAKLCRLSRWEVLRKVEIPYATNGLLWNSMLSMAGGWFFLTVVESFRLGDQVFQVPGIGSYMAVAIEEGNAGAMVAGIGAMIVVIILVDRCLWAPLVYLSQRFQSQESSSMPLAEPLVLRLLERSQLRRLYLKGIEALRERWEVSRLRLPRRESTEPMFGPMGMRVLKWALGVGSVAIFLLGARALYGLLSAVSPVTWVVQLRDTFYTGLRVAAAVVLGSLWTIPVGVWIGSHPRWTNRLQPVVQVAAAFPAPMIFPLLAYALLRFSVPFEFGSVLLMLVGSQFYILFNVIAGATQIPHSLNEVAQGFGVRGWHYWRAIVLPAIFPSLVNGWITASGGAWNASIVSEYVTFDGKVLAATGIGTSITEAAQRGDFAELAGGIFVMVTVLVLINRFFWGWLYKLSETRYRMDE
ncbi:MAG: ABC transporter permease subunit [Bdellovibrionaceae bacterium]|nr:ABC transporter permease subunit [Pseudobdellovibrionaceae bacterium]